MLRRQVLAAPTALGAVLVASRLRAAELADAALIAAVRDPRRSAQNVARDPWRHPAQTLGFWGLRPGMTVVEIDPAGGYWTEILAPYLKATGGHYVAAVGGDPATFAAKFQDQSNWGAISVVPMDGPLGPPGSADMLITARNIHDWMWTPGKLDHLLARHPGRGGAPRRPATDAQRRP
jgi:hypothetical protein